MNDPLSWDPSLVKKFSSSNHYKLLNQLRNEVKKYPLNNKKKTASSQIKDSNTENKNKLNILNKQAGKFSNNSNHSNETYTSKSTVSFNNSKNFSIYNQTINDNSKLKKEEMIDDISKSKDESESPTFKERLNQIDMK